MKHNPIVKNIFLTMLIPTIFMNLTTSIASMADTMIIGHYLDDSALAVVTFATPIYMVINMCAALFAVGGCIAMSIDSGKGEKDTANKAFSTSIELLLIVGILMVLAGTFFSHTITVWLGAEADVFELVELYAKIILVGGPVFVLNTAFAFFVRNDGRPKLSMLGMFGSIGVDITLNFVFVGVMNMGVTGAALSTVIGSFVGILITGTHFLSKKNTLKFHLSFDDMIVRIVKNGASAALHFVYQFLTILIINHFLARLAGTNGVVVYTVVFNLSTLSLSVFEGISQTLQPMASNYYGERSYKNIKETIRLAVVTTLIICGTVTILLEMFPQVVPFVFGIEDASIISQAKAAVRVYAVSMIITTLNVVFGYYLQSTEQNGVAAVFISLRTFVIFLAATLILGKLFGMNGIWAAYTVAEVLSSIICYLMVQNKRAKMKKEGISANHLLLDENVEKNSICLTHDCQNDKFETYEKKVCDCMSDCLAAEEVLIADTKAYLAELAKSEKAKAKAFVEVEINVTDQKIFIRDNLKHGDWKASHGSKSEYGPVLGWNRLCLQRGDTV